MADDNRKRSIDLALGQIEKQFGKGSIMRLGEDLSIPGVKAIPTGALSLNIALGIGGVPRGRIVEIYGPESSGKTTLALHIVAEAQKREALQPLSMPSTPLTSSTPANSASKPMICWSLSQTPVSRLWKSPKFWFAVALSTCWWLIRSLLWFRAPKSKGKWVTLTWVCRPGSCHRLCGN